MNKDDISRPRFCSTTCTMTLSTPRACRAAPSISFSFRFGIGRRDKIVRDWNVFGQRQHFRQHVGVVDMRANSDAAAFAAGPLSCFSLMSGRTLVRAALVLRLRSSVERRTLRQMRSLVVIRGFPENFERPRNVARIVLHKARIGKQRSPLEQGVSVDERFVKVENGGVMRAVTIGAEVDVRSISEL